MRTDWERLRTRLRGRVQDRIDLSRELQDEEVLALIDEEILRQSREEYLLLSEKLRLRRELFNGMRRLDILQELIEDPEVTEIMVNGPDDIFVEKKGRLFRWDRRFSSRTQLEDVVQQIAGKCDRIVNESVPIGDARLENGARVNLVLPPVALNGPIITIRRFPKRAITMKELIAWETISREAADFLKGLVQSGYNLFISGGTGSGKTTFLNALSDFIPKEERIVTIEDNAELQIQGVPNLVKLEARKGNAQGAHEITIRDLIRASLRMRPNRIIVGEVRGEEAIDMLQAFNTGHEGSLSTGHANSPRDMLARLETMVLMGMELPVSAIRRQIASAVDILVHLGRLRDGSRKVLEIVQITGYRYETEEILLEPLYAFEELEKKGDGRVCGSFQKKGELFRKEKWMRAGLAEQKKGRITGAAV